MKLLLTSIGLSTPQLQHVFLNLVKKSSGEVKIAFIPTAAVSNKEKENVVKAKQELIQLGIKEQHIHELNLDHEIIYEEIKDIDAMYVCGGNTFFLLYKMRQSNVTRALQEFLQNNNKVYVGVSAGSIVAAPTIAIATADPPDPNDVGIRDFTGLGLINFEVSPHVPEVVSYKSVEEYAKHTTNKIYAFDHNTALLIENTGEKFVGNGVSKIYN